MFKLLIEAPGPVRPGGFNPSVGILGVQAPQATFLQTNQLSFNPSVGILGVQAGAGDSYWQASTSVSIPRSGFWVFKLTYGEFKPWLNSVSIPRSGFWVFKLNKLKLLTVAILVSIPRSGFWVFKLRRPRRLGLRW